MSELSDLVYEVSKGNAGALEWCRLLAAERRVDLLEQLRDRGINGESLYLRAKNAATMAAYDATRTWTAGDITQEMILT